MNRKVIQFHSTPSWTKDGKVIRKKELVKEALKNSGICWDVIKQPLHRTDNEGNKFNIDNSVALVRQDTNELFGIANKNYQVFQNSETFKLLDTFIEKDELMIDSIVLHGNGKIVIVTCKILIDPVEIQKGDLIECYLIVKNDHSAKGSLKILISGVRVICNNLMEFAEENSVDSISFRHTKSLQSKVSELKSFMNLGQRSFGNGFEVYKQMIDYNLPTYKLKEFLESMFAKQLQDKQLYCYEHGLSTPSIWDLQCVKEIMKKYAKTQAEMPEIDGTLYCVVQAVSDYYSHNSNAYSQLFGRGKSIIKNSVEQAVKIMR